MKEDRERSKRDAEGAQGEAVENRQTPGTNGTTRVLEYYSILQTVMKGRRLGAGRVESIPPLDRAEPLATSTAPLSSPPPPVQDEAAAEPILPVNPEVELILAEATAFAASLPANYREVAARLCDDVRLVGTVEHARMIRDCVRDFRLPTFRKGIT